MEERSRESLCSKRVSLGNRENGEEAILKYQ